MANREPSLKLLRLAFATYTDLDPIGPVMEHYRSMPILRVPTFQERRRIMA